MTALRLTPMSSAISRQVSPWAKRLFRRFEASSVQSGSLAGMLMRPIATSRFFRFLLALPSSDPPRSLVMGICRCRGSTTAHP